VNEQYINACCRDATSPQQLRGLPSGKLVLPDTPDIFSLGCPLLYPKIQNRGKDK